MKPLQQSQLMNADLFFMPIWRQSLSPSVTRTLQDPSHHEWNLNGHFYCLFFCSGIYIGGLKTLLLRHWYELWYQCHGEKYGKQASGGGDVSLVASKHNKKAWMVIWIDNFAIFIVANRWSSSAHRLCCFIAFLCFRSKAATASCNAAQSIFLPNYQLNCIATRQISKPLIKRRAYYAHTGLRYHRVTFWSACTLQIFKNPCVRFTGTQHARTHTSACLPLQPQSKKFMLYYPIKYEMRFISSHLKFEVTAHAF